MTPRELYQLYQALKLHFSKETFDIAVYNIVPVSPTTFAKKGGIKFAMARLAKKYKSIQAIEYLVANFVAGDKYGGVFSKTGEKVYLDWQKRTQSLSYYFKQDLTELRTYADSVQGLFDCSNGHPAIIKAYFGKRCSLETLVVFDKLYYLREKLDEELPFDPVWKELSHLIKKYNSFVTFDRIEYTELVKCTFGTTGDQPKP
jgi:hypothetical protein